MPDIFSNPFFVPTDRAHTISARPKTPSEQCPFRLQHLPVNSYRALSLQKPNRMGDTVLRRNTQQHVHVIRHHLPFQQFDPPLPTKLPDDLSNLLPDSPVQNFPSVFRDDHHMILAFPLYMCFTSIIFHLRSSLAFRGLPQEDRLSFLRWKRQSLVNSHRQSRWFMNCVKTEKWSVICVLN